MRVRGIFAADEDNGIGDKNTLPVWDAGCDLQVFKTLTVGDTLVLGARTLLQMEKRLPYRTVIAYGRDLISGPFDAAHGSAERIMNWAATTRTSTLWIGGGAKTLRAFEPYIHDYVISRIPGVHEADTHYLVPNVFKKLTSTKFDKFTIEHWVR